MKVRDFAEWLFLGAVWGASFLFTRIAAPEFGPIALVDVRLFVAAAVLLLPVILRGELALVRKHWPALLILGAINSAIPFTLFAYATLSLTAGDASVLNATAPLFGGLIGGLVLREKLPAGRITGLIVGFLGVILLVWDKLALTDNLLAVLAGLAAGLLYGISSHLSNRQLKGVPPLTVSMGSLLFAALLLLPFALARLPAALPSGQSWLAATALGVLCSAIAYLLFFRLLRHVGPTRAMTVAYLIPAFGILWGFLILGEPVSLSTLAGGIVIVAGTMLVHFSKNAPTAPDLARPLTPALASVAPITPIGNRQPELVK